MAARPMLSRAAFTLCAILFWLASGSQARPLHGQDECSQGKGRVARTIRTVMVRITPGVDTDAQNEPTCHLIVRDLTGNVILSETDSSFEVLLDNKDLNGDGIPDLVLMGFSGGAHCCWTYFFVSIGPKPALISKLQNQRDATFLTEDKTGRFYLEIEDGAFDYFDGVCHACSPFPEVFLRMEGTNWADIGPEHISDYDDIIRASQEALTAGARQRLKDLKEKPSEDESVRDARYDALMIVFAYLYSGREEKAHQSLRDLWPAFDQERIWNLILETRRNGLLRCTRKDPSAAGMAALLKGPTNSSPDLRLVQNGEFHAQHGVFFIEADGLHVYSALPTILNVKSGLWEPVPNDDAMKARWKGEPFYYEEFQLQQGKWAQVQKHFSAGPNSYLDFGPCDPADQLDLPSTEIRKSLPAGSKIKNVTEFSDYATVVFSHAPERQYPRYSLDAYSIEVALLIRDGSTWKSQGSVDVGADGFFCGTRTLSTRFADGDRATVLLLYIDEPAASSNFRAIRSFIVAPQTKVQSLRPKNARNSDADDLASGTGTRPATKSTRPDEELPHLSKKLVQAVADAESGPNPSAVHVIPRIVAGAVLMDALGKPIPDTVDYGLMQINSINIGKTVLKDEDGNPLAVTESVKTDWKANARTCVALLAMQYRLAEQEQGRKSTEESCAQQAYSGYNGGTRNRRRYLDPE